MTKLTTALSLAESIPETADNYPVLRELVHALKDLVTIANKEASK